MEFSKSDIFKTKYLGRPCVCCGSPQHGLLQAKTQLRTRSGRTIYEYSCPVAGHEEIHKVDKKRPAAEVTISCWLDSERYAQECQYNAASARVKFQELENAVTADYEVVMERFKKQVLEICQQDREIRSAEKRRMSDLLRQERYLMFKNTFLIRPCGLCGAEEHEVLEGVEDEMGIMRYKYSCPSALHEDYEAIKRSPMKSVLSICPRKFARSHLYDGIEIARAISRMRKHREGGMSHEELGVFEQEVREQCMQVIRSSPEERRESRSRGKDGVVLGEIKS